MTDGVGYIEHNGTVTTVEKGDCYIIKKGSGYSYYSDDKKPYSKVWVTVYGSLIDRWLDFYNIDQQVYIKHLDITSYYSQIKQTALGRDMLDNDKKLMLLVHGIIFEMAMATPANSRSREDAPYIKTADNVVLDIKIYREAMQRATDEQRPVAEIRHLTEHDERPVHQKIRHIDIAVSHAV